MFEKVLRGLEIKAAQVRMHSCPDSLETAQPVRIESLVYDLHLAG